MIASNRIQAAWRRLRASYVTLVRVIRVQAILTSWHVVERAGRGLRGASGAFRSMRFVAVMVVAVAIVTPWSLYLQEREHRGEIQRAYRYLATSSTAEITTLRNSMGDLLAEQTHLRDVLLDAGFAVVSDNQLHIPVVATGYSSSVIETDDTPFITASNTQTRVGIIALSRDLLKRYNADAPFAFGDIVHISGVGDFIVEDSMNSRWRRRVDVWFPSRPAAFSFGRRNAVLKATIQRKGEDNETAYNYSLPANLAEGLMAGANSGAANAP